jgi:hypothetical protein
MRHHEGHGDKRIIRCSGFGIDIVNQTVELVCGYVGLEACLLEMQDLFF